MFVDKNPEYFLTVAEAGSFSRAAEKLYISQPYLNEEYGVKLLERPTNELYRLVSDGEADLAVMNTGFDIPERITTETILHERITLRNVTYSTNAATALGLTVRNFGFCFLNETGVSTAPSRDELVFFDLGSPDLIHPLCVLYKKDSYLRPIARAFIDEATRFYRKLDGQAL